MPAKNDIVLSVSDFVAVTNQTLEYVYPNVTIQGELANFRVSKNRWIYFDLKDDHASVRFFGTVYTLPGPLEDGMLVSVRGTPRLHPIFGFSVTVQHIQPVGEGVLRRAAELLQAKLTAEGIFDESNKRLLPYPPQRIGLITSRESAAYADFMKIIGNRWAGMDILLLDVHVQGELAPAEIIEAIEWFNSSRDTPEVIVITRGGGSAEDLAAFNVESVVRAVATSRIPTIVAVGHEIDTSLAELAADKRASTPSNAAELLTPDRAHELDKIRNLEATILQLAHEQLATATERTQADTTRLTELSLQKIHDAQERVTNVEKILQILNPASVVARGFAIVRRNGSTIKSASDLKKNDIVELELTGGRRQAKVE